MVPREPTDQTGNYSIIQQKLVILDLLLGV